MVADNSNGHGDASGNFAGVRVQSSAFIDRFSYTFEFQYLPREQETALVAKISGLPVNAVRMMVDLLNIAREKARDGLLTQAPSLRQLFAWADAVKEGVAIRRAYKSAVINKFPAETAVELDGIYMASINEADFKRALLGG
jgi:MoxR-like ATPase